MPDTAKAISGVATSMQRPDAAEKVCGTFEFSSDLVADNMLWGATLRSPHPSARIERINTSNACRIEGVATVLTAADLPGKPTYGLLISDQPVLAEECRPFRR